MDRGTSSLSGSPIDLFLKELEIDGRGVVTSVGSTDEAAEGEGNVVTGRFVTYGVGNLVTVCLENGSIVQGTRQHPIWSVTRSEWVPLAELQPCELLDSNAGPVVVESVELTSSPADVYNIEVHGHHVYRVAGDGVLVHNAGGDACELARRLGREGEDAQGISAKGKKALDSVLNPGRKRFIDRVTKDFLEEVKNVAKQAYTRQLRDYV